VLPHLIYSRAFPITPFLSPPSLSHRSLGAPLQLTMVPAPATAQTLSKSTTPTLPPRRSQTRGGATVTTCSNFSWSRPLQPPHGQPAYHPDLYLNLIVDANDVGSTIVEALLLVLTGVAAIHGDGGSPVLRRAGAPLRAGDSELVGGRDGKASSGGHCC
jgi:hypothetical protein